MEPAARLNGTREKREQQLQAIAMTNSANEIPVEQQNEYPHKNQNTEDHPISIILDWGEFDGNCY
jgi:hypothetical protein